jgi:hypothetical protein
MGGGIATTGTPASMVPVVMRAVVDSGKLRGSAATSTAPREGQDVGAAAGPHTPQLGT